MAALLGGCAGRRGAGVVDVAVAHPQRRRGAAGAVAQRVARGAAGAGGSGARAPGHPARGDHPRLPVRLHRRRHRPAHRHVDGRRPAAELERAGRLGGQPRRARKAVARRGSRRRTRRPRRGAHAAALDEDPAVVPVRLRARRAAGLARDDAPAGARAAAGARRSRGAAPPRRGRPLGGGGHPARPRQLGAADHRRDVRPRERRRDGPHGRRGRGRPWKRSVRRAARHRDRRRAAHRALAAAVRRRRSRLEGARRGVAQPGCGDRRLGRRAPIST